MRKNLVRWILVIPCSLIGIGLAFIFGLIVKSQLDSFCPAEWRTSGMCMWEPGWIGELPIAIGAGLAAFLFVFLAALTAPTRKTRVAVVMYGIGVLFVTLFAATALLVAPAFDGGYSSLKHVAMPCSSALAFGFLAVVSVRRSNHRSNCCSEEGNG